ncbi:hypothetical protein [Pseudomonas proteolytica]|uniref:hypothetical protein n=1 Tax=Pseudomonas proteolytica TaxID=219574 RepID=UPI000894236E|nr:hypothetical protein [Pseudomonas proteolytica]KAA8702441.1 hypothetical protein F4W61_11530 [Pseudomonas proteolytica]TWR76259.1 hypothetical protein FIV38_24075 [Pseudomonas proteolytica]SEE79754.1 hypothetical protein SAMN04490200_5487 [Pseudomonas proteolytica]
MTYVREQTSAELSAHIRSLQKMAGWFDPLSDRLWQEVEALQAENAGLKTGYEAYERVNAELKAEVEVLRKDADRAAYWKQRAKSAEGHLFSGDFRAAAMELHKYSRFESTPWPELTGSQHALISSAAGAVIATVNRLRDARRPKNRDETDAIIWCACGDGYPVNSYGAGFMAANGDVCENCDAANGRVEPHLDTPDELKALRQALTDIFNHVEGNTECLVRDLVNWGTPRINPNDFYDECEAIKEIANAALGQGERGGQSTSKTSQSADPEGSKGGGQ